MATNKAKKTSDQTSSSKGTSNETSTSTPNVPDWLLTPAQKQAGQIGDIMGQGAGAYTPQISGLQQQSFKDAANLTTSPYFKQAGDQIAGVGDVSSRDVEGQSLLTGLSDYYNPFKEQVLNPVLSDYDEQSGQTRAAQAAAAARGKAFQGSRFGIQEGQTEGQLARGRAATEGNLLGSMYSQATGLSGEDAARRQQAMQGNQASSLQAALANQQAGLSKASLLQGLGTAQGSEDRANLGIRAGLGGVQTDAENAIRQYPMEFARQTGGLLQGMNPAQYFGRTTTGEGATTTDSTGHTVETSDPGLLSSLGQVAGIASLFVSDARVKQDVRTEGHDAKGRRVVSFAYIWAPWKRWLGFLAHELLASDPHAVTVGPGGLMLVDYGAL